MNQKEVGHLRPQLHSKQGNISNQWCCCVRKVCSSSSLSYRQDGRCQALQLLQRQNDAGQL